ncbi:MAG TPA: hypothetical protein PLV42_05540 [bacterium]|nr:hypothetical protein [bacterium]
MTTKNYTATIRTKADGHPVKITVQANDVHQARSIIEMRPEFKQFVSMPKELK